MAVVYLATFGAPSPVQQNRDSTSVASGTRTQSTSNGQVNHEDNDGVVRAENIVSGGSVLGLAGT